MKGNLQVVVVGAGIGGLAAAVALTQKGHQVVVYEREAEVSEIGAGIQVTPNFTRILQRWGLSKGLHQVGVNPGWGRQRRWEDGSILSQAALNHNGRMQTGYGAPYYHIHRADLQALLLQQAKESGVTCNTNAHVVDYIHRNGEDVVVLADGSHIRADLIVAADGSRSRLAKHVLGHDVPNDSVGDSAYRGLIPRQQMQDPVFEDLNLEYNTDIWIGPNSHVVTYYVRGGDLFNVVAILPDEPGEESFKAPGDMKKLWKHFEGWDPRLKAMLSKIDHSYVWKLRDRPQLERWVHPQGNLVLLGDAAHPMLPYVAQGASSAVEDAAVLAECLEYLKPGMREIRSVLQTYERLRKPRALRMKEVARSNRKHNHMPDGAEQRARDEAMRNENVNSSSLNTFKDRNKGIFMFGHDVVREVRDHFQTKAKL